jgi:hypothetical protein
MKSIGAVLFSLSLATAQSCGDHDPTQCAGDANCALGTAKCQLNFEDYMGCLLVNPADFNAGFVDEVGCSNVTSTAGNACYWYGPGELDDLFGADNPITPMIAGGACLAPPLSLLGCEAKYPDETSCTAAASCIWAAPCEENTSCNLQTTQGDCTAQDGCFWSDATGSFTLTLEDGTGQTEEVTQAIGTNKCTECIENGSNVYLWFKDQGEGTDCDIDGGGNGLVDSISGNARINTLVSAGEGTCQTGTKGPPGQAFGMNVQCGDACDWDGDDPDCTAATTCVATAAECEADFDPFVQCLVNLSTGEKTGETACGTTQSTNGIDCYWYGPGLLDFFDDEIFAGGACLGPPSILFGCGTYDNEAGCTGTAGCKWGPNCKVKAGYCEDETTKDGCTGQDGCYWNDASGSFTFTLNTDNAGATNDFTQTIGTNKCEPCIDDDGNNSYLWFKDQPENAVCDISGSNPGLVNSVSGQATLSELAASSTCSAGTKGPPGAIFGMVIECSAPPTSAPTSADLSGGSSVAPALAALTCFALAM